MQNGSSSSSVASTTFPPFFPSSPPSHSLAAATSSRTRQRKSKLLLELDSDTPEIKPRGSYQRATRQSVHGRSAANYDQRFHPMDLVLRAGCTHRQPTKQNVLPSPELSSSSPLTHTPRYPSPPVAQQVTASPSLESSPLPSLESSTPSVVDEDIGILGNDSLGGPWDTLSQQAASLANLVPERQSLRLASKSTRPLYDMNKHPQDQQLKHAGVLSWNTGLGISRKRRAVNVDLGRSAASLNAQEETDDECYPKRIRLCVLQPEPEEEDEERQLINNTHSHTDAQRRLSSEFDDLTIPAADVFSFPPSSPASNNNNNLSSDQLRPTHSTPARTTPPVSLLPVSSPPCLPGGNLSPSSKAFPRQPFTHSAFRPINALWQRPTALVHNSDPASFLLSPDDEYTLPNLDDMLGNTAMWSSGQGL